MQIDPIIEVFKDRGELIRALMRQALVQCDGRIARALATKVQLVRAKPGKAIIIQGTKDHHLYLILAGTFDVCVNGRRVSSRGAGENVGEMALILKSCRTATVTATTDGVLAKLAWDAFLTLADQHPAIWRGLSEQLAAELHKRRQQLREQNTRPRIFIGSSGKHKEVAERIRDRLSTMNVDVQAWFDPGVFEASDTFIEALERATQEADFGILVFGKDDIIESHGKASFVPRDNVVFEAGLFVGALTRKRTIIVAPLADNFRMLSDLDGVTVLVYRRTRNGIDVDEAVAQIKQRVETMWVR